MPPCLPRSLAVAIICVHALCEHVEAAPQITGVFVGGREYPAPRGPLHVVETNDRVRFEIKNPPGEGAALRWRFKLSGVDADWRDRDVSARFYVAFRSADARIISEVDSPLHGQTPGWQGGAEQSAFFPKRLQIAAPAKAAFAQIIFSSSGTCIGEIFVERVRVLIDAPGQPQRVVALEPAGGSDLARPDGQPTNWQRQGTMPSQGILWQRPGPAPCTVLGIVDNHPLDYVGWASNATANESRISVREGDTLTVEWNIAYSIGRGDDGVVEYRGLKAGRYRMEVAPARVDGSLTGEGAALELVVTPPWHERPEGWIAIGAGLLGSAGWVGRVRRRRRFARLEAQHALEAERTRIARDLHDELGASLTHIAMLSELAQEEVAEGKAGGGSLGAISARAHAAASRLREIVWAIDSANDSVEHLVGFLGQYFGEYLQVAGLNFRLDAPEMLPPLALTATQRSNLFLAAREALHNVVKHAGACEVWLRVQLDPRALTLTIEDNGCGFDSAGHRDGCGSANMRARLAQIGGRFVRISVPGKGTIVTLILSPAPA